MESGQATDPSGNNWTFTYTDVNENIIYTGEGKNHPGLYRNVLFVSNEEIHWIRTDLALKNNESVVWMRFSPRTLYCKFIFSSAPFLLPVFK